MSEIDSTSQVTVGRYVLHRQIARGGMATIHIARLMGDEGFSRIVAAKRLLPEFAEDSEFVAMFMDEARIASKVHHRNVVPVLDLVTTSDDVMLVQEYVHGVPLHTLLRTAYERKQHIPVRIAVSIATQVLSGLHAAHETADEMGAPLGIVHRDVSPQNIMVATDGSARLLDFGVAKATMAAHVTAAGTFKGKLAYSAPEQLEGKANRQSDIYALAVVLWELIVGHRLHGTAQGEAELVSKVMSGQLPSITDALGGEAEWGAVDEAEWALIEKIEPIVSKGLAVKLADRWETAADMERALTDAVTAAPAVELAAWVKSIGKEFLEGRDKVIAAEEQSWRRATGSSPGTRKTPMPFRVATVPGTVRTGTKHPIAPSSGGKSKVIVGVLGLLVVLLGVGLVFAMQSSKSAEATPQSTPAKVATPAPAPAPAATPAPAPTQEAVA
ncbi:MAG: serine/threonine protein kinase, partial [Deltaproteobacteria bacterium]|nr:serine/threonine protein kinase [Deltaproteobacteria bacterium]